MKPLFIPLKTEFYEAFERGEKMDELRLYGPRWNRKTCKLGRDVILSKGYGKKNRMIGKIIGFIKANARHLSDEHQKAILECYGTLDKAIAFIMIDEIKRIGERI